MNNASVTASRRTLVTGAGGYVGGHLVRELLRAGRDVRCMSRNPEKLILPQQADRVKADVLEPASLASALSGIDVAYYLVHSMESSRSDQRSFASRDRDAARNFLKAAETAGVKRIIYLGGLGDKQQELSPHLASRIEVGEILQSSNVPATVLRAAVIVGPWGSSFQMIQGLVERLPVMITPRWVETACQPIALRDVLHYLVRCLEVPETEGQTLDIGGPDILTYREMMMEFARLLNCRRWIIGVPVLSPRLSSYWVNLVTPIRASLARPLIDGLKHPVVCRDDSVQRMMPHECLSYRVSVQQALDEQGAGTITWTGKYYELHWRQFIRYSPAQLMDFYRDPGNLIPMTPVRLRFRLLPPAPETLTAGTRMNYSLRVFGVPVRWASQIVSWEPPSRFQDTQLTGPYRRWDHTHTFEPGDDGTWVIDEVQYELPLGVLGRVAHALAVARELRRIFRFRSRALHRLMAKS